MQGGEKRGPLFLSQAVVGKENKRGVRRCWRRSLGEWPAAVQRCSEEHHAGKNCTVPESATRCKRAWGSRLDVHRCILALGRAGALSGTCEEFAFSPNLGARLPRSYPHAPAIRDLLC